MSVPVQNRISSRGPDLLIAHCAALDSARPRVTVRLHRLIGPDLTRLLVVALAGDHRMDGHPPRGLVSSHRWAVAVKMNAA